jgi:hypothetical protein
MEKALSLAGMLFRRVWADEAESVALQPKRLDPVAGSHSAAAALVRCSSSEDCGKYRMDKPATNQLNVPALLQASPSATLIIE